MTIGELAKAAGVPTTTVRFYERAGLMRPDHRTGSNYRDYGDKSLERLRFIKSAQAVGLSIKDVSELLALTTTDESPCEDVAKLLDHRLRDIRQKMKDLRRVERTLVQAIHNCCTADDPGLCTGVTKLRGKNSCSAA